jgi:hypothetical protein
VFDMAQVTSTSTWHRSAASIKQYVNALFGLPLRPQQELPLGAPAGDHVELARKDLDAGRR